MVYIFIVHGDTILILQYTIVFFPFNLLFCFVLSLCRVYFFFKRNVEYIFGRQES